MKDKKAQMKIQEMAFVLLALVLLAVIGFIFFIRFSQQSLVQSAQDIKTKTTMSLLERISSLPELECYNKALCIDETKANKFIQLPDSDKQELEMLFQGLTSVRIRKIYPQDPQNPEIILYYKSAGNSSYSAFINLCRYVQVGSSGTYNYECGMAQLVASQK